MQRKLIVQTEEFVKRAFIKHPHFSFGHWSVMYNHSVLVKDIALRISEQIECDKTLVALGALLHDVGKTHVTDHDILHFEHEKFNLPISESFIDDLSLSEEGKRKLKDIVAYISDSTEAKIIKDADALALYADKKLYMLFIKWAVENKLDTSIQRKFDKFQKLIFSISRDIGKEWFENMKNDWEIYMREHMRQ